MDSLRRRCVLAIAASWLGRPVAAVAQATARPYRIGFLSGGAESASAALIAAFRDGLRDLGWAEGRNIVVEWRFAEGRNERLPDLAAGLVRDKVDVIVAQPYSAVRAARQATATIPIVMAAVTDPVAQGLVASLSRPGGNVTGLAYSVDTDIFAKQLQLLKETVPAARRVAVLYNVANASTATATAALRSAAPSMGIALGFHAVRAPEEFEGAFAGIVKERSDAVLVLGDPMFGLHAARLAELATKHRLPTMHAVRANVDAGGLILYGPDITLMIRQAAGYVDRILKGASPSELPVEHPNRFLLVVNLKTARALGLTIPPAVLLRADRTIE